MLRGAQGARWWLQTTREIEIEKLIFHRLWRNLRGHKEGLKQSWEPGTHVFFRVREWSSLGFPRQGQMGQSVQLIEVGLVSPIEVPLMGTEREGIGRQMPPLITRLLGLYEKLKFTCDSAGCYLGHALAWGARVSSRSPQAAGPPEIDAELCCHTMKQLTYTLHGGIIGQTPGALVMSAVLDREEWYYVTMFTWTKLIQPYTYAVCTFLYICSTLILLKSHVNLWSIVSL